MNEAWLRLQNERGAALPGRTQGLALAAQAMRRVLVDHGRHQKSQKRGGRLPHVELDDLLHAAKTAAVPVEDLLTLESALTRLEAIDPRGAEIVALRFFSGLSVPEVAEHLGVSVSTVEGKWTHARAWLRRDLGGSEYRVVDCGTRSMTTSTSRSAPVPQINDSAPNGGAESTASPIDAAMVKSRFMFISSPLILLTRDPPEKPLRDDCERLRRRERSRSQGR